ncbi:8060_t:CDS:2 [Entrophospora sp. SA101]|nr:8060_t:CDS:2 [Entrophospora sp. SA101]
MSKIEEIHQHVNKINEKIPLLQKEMVIIIGDTGEGKSSLLNYLAEVPMFSKEKEEGFVVCTESPLEMQKKIKVLVVVSEATTMRSRNRRNRGNRGSRGVMEFMEVTKVMKL